MTITENIVTLTVTYARRLSCIHHFRNLVDEILSNDCVVDRNIAIRIANRFQETIELRFEI